MATEPYNCFAVAAPGLEPIVARELLALGERPRVEDGGVSWTGDARSVMRANLWLRTATRVLVRVAKFRATTFAELERNAKRVNWERHVGPGRAVEFAVTAKKSKLIHTAAIEERLRSAFKPTAREPRPKTQDPSLPSQLFVVRAIRDEFEVSADSSGELLHMRGYRQAVGKAPIRETLAAALLLAADWNGSVPLIDPFCGSGTIPIEAGLIARRIAPGINRSFSVLTWPGADLAAWTNLFREARASELPASPVAICGSDRDKGAIAASIANAARAGVKGDVEFTQRSLSAIVPPAVPGLVATNPPYGMRASPKADVRNLYAQLGNVARSKLVGWRIALFSAQDRLAAEVKLETAELFRTTNGGIRVSARASDVIAP